MNLHALKSIPLHKRLLLAVLVCVVLQVAVEWTVFGSSQDTLQDLQTELTQHKLQNSLSTKSQPASSESLEYFLGILKRQPSEQARILRLHQEAAKNSVRIRKSNYQKSAMPGGIVRTEMQSDVSGSYPAIRQYLRAVEVSDATTAIDGISFSRPAAGAEVRAQIRFVLYTMPSVD